MNNRKSGYQEESEENNMNYNKLAKDIRSAYKKLKKDEINKLFYVQWNDKLKISEIIVENDAGFKAIMIGNTSGIIKSRGYMYLFYTNNENIPFPTVKEIERRLKIVANKKVLTDNDAKYFDWDEYGSLEKQRDYFSEIVISATIEE